MDRIEGIIAMLNKLGFNETDVQKLLRFLYDKDRETVKAWCYGIEHPTPEDQEPEKCPECGSDLAYSSDGMCGYCGVKSEEDQEPEKE
jgi:hypothetical protein